MRNKSLFRIKHGKGIVLFLLLLICLIGGEFSYVACGAIYLPLRKEVTTSNNYVDLVQPQKPVQKLDSVVAEKRSSPLSVSGVKLGEDNTTQSSPWKYFELFKDEEVTMLNSLSGKNYLFNVTDPDGPVIDSVYTWNTEFGYRGSGAYGNLDDDPEKELIAGGFESDPIVYDDARHSYDVITTLDYGGQTDIVTGDIDGDHLDEIIMYRVRLVVLDDALHNFTLLYESNNTVFNPNPNHARTYVVEEYSAELTTGDIDGDGLDEIGLIVQEPDSSYPSEFTFLPWYFVIDDGKHGFDIIFERKKEDHTSSTVSITMADIDGDHVDELVTLSEQKLRAYKYDTFTQKWKWLDTLQVCPVNDFWSFKFSITHAYLTHESQKETIIVFINSFPNFRGFSLGFYQLKDSEWTKVGGSNVELNVEVLAGDIEPINIDNDFDTEFVIAVSTRPSVVYGIYSRTVYFIDDFNHFEQYSAPSILWEKTFYYYDSDYIKTDIPVLCVGDIDGDSVVGKLIDYNETVSNPYIFVVMAAPPVLKGINQNYGASSTSYSIANTLETSYSSGYTVTASTVVSYEVGFSLGPVKFGSEFSISLQSEIEKTVGHTSSITYSQEYVTDSLDDYVIFEGIIYDNYYFEIVRGKEEDIGKKFCLSIPQDKNIYKWTVSYFNSHNGDAPDIGPEVLNHTVGEVWTYPSPEQRDSILRKYYKYGAWRSEDKMAVGQGGGYNSLSISLLKEATTSTTLSMSVEVSNKMTVGGYSLGFSIGYGRKVAYEIKVGKNTVFSGSVGDISTESEYEKYRYSFGLFVYNYHEIEDDKTVRAFQVIDYWVEDYHGPHELPTNTSSPTTSENPETTSNQTGTVNNYLENFLTKKVQIYNINIPLPGIVGGIFLVIGAGVLGRFLRKGK